MKVRKKVKSMMNDYRLVRNKKEAIEVLRSNKPSSGYEMLQDAIDIAIEALEEGDENVNE